MKKINYILFGIVLALQSCNFLDVDPTDFLTTEQYYKTDAQVDNALNSAYKTLRNIYSNYALYINGNSDEQFYYQAGTNSRIMYNEDATNTYVLNLWSDLYSGVKNCNYLLQGLEANKNTLSEATYNHAKGEALFLRAYYNFMLVQWYSYPETGIPMSLAPVESFEETKIPLTKMDVMYDQIIKDMEDAESYLQDQTVAGLGYTEKVTIDAVDGMLARVCLYAAGYPNEGGSNGKEYYYNKVVICSIIIGHYTYLCVSNSFLLNSFEFT